MDNASSTVSRKRKIDEVVDADTSYTGNVKLVITKPLIVPGE